MDSRIFVDIADQLKQINKQQAVANYLKIYELTKDPKALAWASSLLGYKSQKNEEENEMDTGYKSPLR